MKNINGEKIGKLRVLDFAYRNESVIYMKCKCDCGNTCYVSRTQLMKKVGGTKSCGCIRAQMSRDRIHTVKPYAYNRQNANKKTAVVEFDNIMSQISERFNIPETVSMEYSEMFRTNIGFDNRNTI